MSQLTYIYFSATSTTQKAAETVGSALGLPIAKSINIADYPDAEFQALGEDDVVIVAAPVYGGRLPDIFVRALGGLKGNGATAIAIVVYGNRDYDDALLELKELLIDKGFNLLGAGAFIGQHSIFPKVGVDRPDAADMIALTEFGQACRRRMSVEKPYGDIIVKGKRPYKKYNGVGLIPECDRSLCVSCGKCSRMCPTDAIYPDRPYETDKNKCISCGRCIYNCSNNARRYTGLKYNLIGKIFVAEFSKRKNPEWVVAQ